MRTIHFLSASILSALIYTLPAHAEIVIPASGKAPIAAPALTAICGQYIDVDSALSLDPHQLADLPSYISLITTPTADVKSSGSFYLGSLDVADHVVNGCVSPGEQAGGAAWPITPTGYGAARWSAYINVPGTAGTPVKWTIGLVANDSAQLTIGGQTIASLEFLPGNWKAFKWVTFSEPGVYPITIEWATNHSCNIDPLEVLFATSQVANYEDVDCVSHSTIKEACDTAVTGLHPTSDFAILGAPYIMQTEDGSYPLAGKDSDGDGLDDGREQALCGVSTFNSDGDTLVNFLDPDDDGDGIDTKHEDINGSNGPTDDDTDGDGTPNYLDVDDDGDGIKTEYEAADPNDDGDPADARSSDGDAIPDYLENDDDGDGVLTRFEAADPNADGNPSDARNTDSDTKPDYLDSDDDNDGVLTADENADPNSNGDPADAADLDNDGVPDFIDANASPKDSDGDGVPDFREDVNGDGNLNNDDTDGDGTPDFMDDDDDGDRIPTRDEHLLGDTDGDGTPDYRDADDDGDNVPSGEEFSRGDTDGDGKPNYLDNDDDGDMVLTSEELQDVDGNGVLDYLESPTADSSQSAGVAGGAGDTSCAVSTHSTSISWEWLMALGWIVAAGRVRAPRFRRGAA